MDLIEKIIKQISNKYSSTDPFVICKFKKIQCLEYPFTDNTLSFSYFYNKNWIVLLRQDLSPLAKKFACGHELAHIILHSNENYIKYSTQISLFNPSHEKEADTFSLLLFDNITFNKIKLNTLEKISKDINLPLSNLRHLSSRSLHQKM